MKAIKIAIDVLDHLDPILGYDLSNILEEPGDDPEKSLRDICTTCRCRQVVHGDGDLADLWQCAIDALDIAIEGVPTC